MAFPFKEAECKLFKNTFLQSVIITYRFEKLDSELFDDAFERRMKDYLCGNFGLTIEKSIKNGPISITSSDKSVSYVLSDEFVAVKVNAKNYKSFGNSVIQYNDALKLFIRNVLQIESVVSLSLRKINIWPFRNDSEEEIDQNELWNKILSKDILQIAQVEEDSKFAGSRIFEGEDKDISVKIRLVPVNATEDGKQMNYVVDIETALSPTFGVELKRTREKLRNLNQKLYDAFIWAINPKIISLMEGKDYE